jgi:hypothetical protein
LLFDVTETATGHQRLEPKWATNLRRELIP